MNNKGNCAVHATLSSINDLHVENRNSYCPDGLANHIYIHTYTHIYKTPRKMEIERLKSHLEITTTKSRTEMHFLGLLTLCSFAAAANTRTASSQSSSLEHSWDEPASLQATTDDEGNQVTRTLWWIPPSSSDASHSEIPSKSEDGPATILTSSNSQGEYTSTIWWLPSTSSQQGFTSKAPRTTIVSEKHGEKSTSTISNPLLSPSSSSLACLLTSASITNKKSGSDNSTIPVHSNAGGKIVDMSCGIGAIALALMLI
ncbi:hypothetical protein ZYGR_0AG01030 [Zygosaccharomyces rouxii]|uniref:Uncharacterized protein n=1 Tax=Zygosaccharomyces rouxii TaxID=4956 RepID=A0A1Q3A8S8_ZYGRO|nr:hypothetical protein ZYGR_0AG01030 [Zygosaccharomyces rouxii]